MVDMDAKFAKKAYGHILFQMFFHVQLLKVFFLQNLDQYSGKFICYYWVSQSTSINQQPFLTKKNMEPKTKHETFPASRVNDTTTDPKGLHDDGDDHWRGGKTSLQKCRCGWVGHTGRLGLKNVEVFGFPKKNRVHSGNQT